MNVGLDHERVRTHRLDRVGDELVPCGHDELTDTLNRRRLQQADVVANPLPREVRLVELANFHDRPQCAMVLGEVMQLVVIQIAPQPHRRQHQDAPITQSLASTIGSRLGRDVTFHQLQNRIADLGRRVNLLQASQNRDQLVSAIEIQHHLRHTAAIQPPLPFNRLAHPFAPRR